jgi:arginase
MPSYPAVQLIGSATSWGAQLHETEMGPYALKALAVEPSLPKTPIRMDWGPIVAADVPASSHPFVIGAMTLPHVREQAQRLGFAVQNALQEGYFPLVVGGDHAASIGTWSAITQFKAAQQAFGLIWIDAHMDSHTPETSPSYAFHGMPLAALMGHGEPSLVHLLSPEAKLSPEHVVLIGVRSFEDGEAMLLKQLGVRVYFIEEVLQRGFATVFHESLQRVQQNTRGFGVSLDLDVFDPFYAPGVGSQEPKGISPQALMPLLPYLWENPNFSGFEIVEYNPARDEHFKTAHLVRDLLKALANPKPRLHNTVGAVSVH